MYAKFSGVAFMILLYINSTQANALWRLECDDLGPAECKTKLRDLILKAMHIEFLHLIENICDHLANALKQAENTYDPTKKETSYQAIQQLEDFKREAFENRNNKNELKSVMLHKILSFTKANELLRTELKRRPEIRNEIVQMPMKLYKPVWLDILSLFEGLRPIDFDTFGELNTFRALMESCRTLQNDADVEQFKVRVEPVLEFFDLTRTEFELL